MAIVLNEIYPVLERWAVQNLDGPVRLYDFGDGQTNMPVPDPKSGSYLTKSVCFLYLEGKGSLDLVNVLPREEEGIKDCGNGWKFLVIEIGYQWTPEQMKEALEKGKEKLLAAR